MLESPINKETLQIEHHIDLLINNKGLLILPTSASLEDIMTWGLYMTVIFHHKLAGFFDKQLIVDLLQNWLGVFATILS